MSFRLGIIGGGWYGCHIALTFRNLGLEVVLFEKQRQLMHGASGNNQFRLHMGFHYARHHATRTQSRDGFFRFIERYPHLSAPFQNNIYAIPRGESLIDYHTYKLIMQSSGITFSEMFEVPKELRNVEGAILTQERVLLVSAARDYFLSELSKIVQLGHPVDSIQDRGDGVWINGQRFDYAVDATWGHLTKPKIPCIYEPTVLLYYEAAAHSPAYTFVDGPLYSVYPTEDTSVFTLSSVKHTPLGQFSEPQEALALLDSVGGALIGAKREQMEQQCRANLPGFTDSFKFLGVQLAIKTKPIGASDDRSCYVERLGRRFVVLSGKIDTVFHAAERIIADITSEGSAPANEFQPRLRDNIIQVKG